MTVLVLALLLLPLLGAVVCASLRGARATAWISAGVCAATLGLTIALVARVLAGGEAIVLRGWFHVDALGVLLATAICVVGGAAAWYAAHRPPIAAPAPDWTSSPARYHALFLVLHASLLTALLANNLGVMWIAIEGSTLASALLVGYDRRPTAIEAGWKFLILCSVGIVLALLGTVLLYYSAVGVFGESAAGLEWSSLRDVASRLEPRFVKLAFLFALVGYGTKAGIAPMHTWLPDAHAEAPTPVSAVLSGGVLSVSLGALLRFHAIVGRCVGTTYSETLLLVFGLLSMAVAVPFMLVQNDYKRLLAYSSIENIGLSVFAIGLGAPLALFGGLLHLVVQAFAKTLAFLVGGTLASTFGSRRMDHWSGVLEFSPAVGALFIVAGVGLAALPPAATFLSEWLILLGGLHAGRTVAVFATIAMLALVFAGFAYHWTRIVLGKPRVPVETGGHAAYRRPMWVLVAMLLVLGVWIPAPLRRLVEQAAAVIRP